MLIDNQNDDIEFDIMQQNVAPLFKSVSDTPVMNSNVANTTALLKEQRNRINQLEQQLQQVNGKDSDSYKTHIQHLTSENMKLVQRLRVLETAAKASNVPVNQGELQAKCNLLMKERDAMCTIMEQKIKLLVSNISQAVGVILQNDRTDGSSNSPSRALTQVSNIHA